MPIASEDLSVIPKPIVKGSPVLALILVCVAGLIDLRKPFAGDQALFVIGGRALARGGVLYQDFWDLKQPGIYWFYQLGLKIHATPEVAVHSLELAYFLLFSIIMMLSLWRYFGQPIFAALAAAVVCGIYFVICGDRQLTQVEGLVGFPLFVCAWLSLQPSSRMLRGRLFIAGISAGCVAMLKLMLVPLPICFLFMLIWRQRRNRSSLLACLFSMLVFAFGLMLVLLPLLYDYFSRDQLVLLYDTFVTDPMRITRELPHTQLSVLKSGAIWFIRCMGLLLPLAVVGGHARRKDWFAWGLILWIIGGLALVILQRKGWDYHYLMLLAPIGILAANGAEVLFTASKRRAVTLLPIFLLSPYLLIGLVKGVTQIHDPRPAFYSDTVRIASVVNEPNAAPGPIYVLGTPLIYYLSDRTQAIALNGWSPEWFLDDQWKATAIQIQLKQPAYIFVSADDQDALNQRGQAVAPVLKDDYALVKSNEDGVWYKRKRL